MYEYIINIGRFDVNYSIVIIFFTTNIILKSNYNLIFQKKLFFKKKSNYFYMINTIEDLLLADFEYDIELFHFLL